MCEICGKSGARQTGPLMIIVETRGKAFRKDRAAMHVKFCKIEVEMRNKLQRLEMLLFAHLRWNFQLAFPSQILTSNSEQADQLDIAYVNSVVNREISLAVLIRL